MGTDKITLEYNYGQLVISKAGHDKNKIYAVVREEADHVYLADGKLKTLQKLKKKNKKHIQIINYIDRELAEKNSRNQKIENSDIIRAIKLYESGFEK